MICNCFFWLATTHWSIVDNWNCHEGMWYHEIDYYQPRCYHAVWKKTNELLVWCICRFCHIALAWSIKPTSDKLPMLQSWLMLLWLLMTLNYSLYPRCKICIVHMCIYRIFHCLFGNKYSSITISLIRKKLSMNLWSIARTYCTNVVYMTQTQTVAAVFPKEYQK